MLGLIRARLLTSATDLARFDAWVRGQPGGSLWQSMVWGEYQRALGRSIRVFAVERGKEIAAGCLVIVDQTTFGLTTWEAPRGPVWAKGCEHEATTLVGAIMEAAQAEGGMSVDCSPLFPLPSPPQRLSPSGRFVQPEATRLIDLTESEDDILAQMHHKGRYNIRIAERDGVFVRPAYDVTAFHTLLSATADRDGFKPPSLKACKAFLSTLPGSFLLLAYRDTSSLAQPIAGLLGVAWESTGIYYYGASDHAYRALMAPYLLQWTAMRLCKRAGCARYDLLGVAPHGAGAKHPWQGISGFKEKFGGMVRAYPAERRAVLRPWLSGLLGMKRRLLG